jgi:23S rRNA pseudouridine2605 synthase
MGRAAALLAATPSASFGFMGGKVGVKRGQGQAPGRQKAKAPLADAGGSMRIAKAIAHAGLCSRRDAEAWIAAGRVAVNGKALTTPAHVVSPGDRITVDGKPLPEAQGARLWRYHKRRGLVTSHKDPQGRKTVFDALPPGLPRVVSVGRLDINTEGLLLLTTDGELARHLELPSTGWLRRYRVRAHGKASQEALDALRQGVTLDGIRYGPVDARLDREQGSNLWLTISLREGKNREVKRIAEHLGLTVNRLIRVSFGPFSLGDLPEGAVEEVKRRVLADQLGRTLTEQFGLEAPEKLRRKARRK